MAFHPSTIEGGEEKFLRKKAGIVNMGDNPLIGKTLSLISKKNIRYLGTLYSINETNATVALQNVRSYGTEGREEEGKFVAPTDAVHPFLLFRGQDIKDLHVHEEPEKPVEGPPAANVRPEPLTNNGSQEKSPTPTQQTVPKDVGEATSENAVSAETGLAPTATQSTVIPKTEETTTTSEVPKATTTTTGVVASATVAEPFAVSEPSSSVKIAQSNSTVAKPQQHHGGPPSTASNQGGRRGRGGGRGGTNNRKPSAAPGTGASLLNRTTRGSNSSGKGITNFQQDFDFQSSLEEFRKENNVDEVNKEGKSNSPEGDDVAVGGTAYEKDDFFDSISNDASDRANGIDNRLRGREERNLNTETFGAVALNHSDNYRRRGGRGGGRGRSGGRGPGGGGGSAGGGRWRGGGRYSSSDGRGGGRGGGRGSGGERGGGRHRGMGFRDSAAGRPGATASQSSATTAGGS